MITLWTIPQIRQALEDAGQYSTCATIRMDSIRNIIKPIAVTRGNRPQRLFTDEAVAAYIAEFVTVRQSAEARAKRGY